MSASSHEVRATSSARSARRNFLVTAVTVDTFSSEERVDGSGDGDDSGDGEGWADDVGEPLVEVSVGPGEQPAKPAISAIASPRFT